MSEERVSAGLGRRLVANTMHAATGRAVAAGVAASLALDRVLPAARGLTAWALRSLLSGVGATAAAIVLVATRYFDWRAARMLLLSHVTPRAGNGRQA